MANDNDNKRRLAECHFNFPPEIIDLIVDNFNKCFDKGTLNNLRKVSHLWEHAATKKMFSETSKSDLDIIIKRPYPANNVKELEHLDPRCGYCYKLEHIKFPNLKTVLACHDCDKFQQFLGKYTSIKNLNVNHLPSKTALSILKTIRKARMQIPTFQPLLSYTGFLDKEIARCLQKLGTRSIHATEIYSKDIVPSFSHLRDLQDISLRILKFEEDTPTLPEAVKYLNKFKSLRSFEINLSQRVLTSFDIDVVFEYILKPNATTLEKVEIGKMRGVLKLPLDHHWPNLKKLRTCNAEFIPMDLIKFSKMAPNLQYVT